ncbi:MAG: hypothetical protein V5A68_00970 [Candidatus Thermoplasmatota archaeon]
MKRYFKTTKLTLLFVFAILFFLGAKVTIAEPNIEIKPTKPKPLDTVKFTASIPDKEDLEKVTIRVQECGNEPDIGYICYTDEFNKTMTESSSNTYEAEITLKHENAIEIKYELHYLSGGKWYKYPEGNNLIKVDLDTSIGGKSSETPGFETAILLISAIFISMILYKQNR